MADAVAETGLSWEALQCCSLEQILLLLAAAQRRNARRTLALAGAMGAALADAGAWRRVAAALQEQASAGL